MSARTRIAILVAAAILAALLGFLLSGGNDPGGGRPESRGRTPGPGPDAATSLERPPPPKSASSDPGADPVPAGPTLVIRARIEGDWPLPGVEILPVERHTDGTLIACVGEGAPDGGETDAEGSITIRYTTEPAERLFGVLGDDDVPDGAENAEPAGEIRRFRVYRAAGDGPVTLRFRDPEGTVLLRPVDAATGEVLSERDGILVSARSPGEDSDALSGLARKQGTWLRWFPGEGTDFRLHVPGYLPSPAPDGGWTKRTVVRMESDPAAIRGNLVAGEEVSIECELLSAADGSPCDSDSVAGLPRRSGPFAISGVPPGTWDLVVTVEHGDTARWATVRFTGNGVGVDLGEVRPIPGAVLRARVLGTDDPGKPERSLHLFRAYPGEMPQLRYAWNSNQRTREMSATWAGHPWREADSRDPSADGWVEFRGLRPGGSYLLGSVDLPGQTREVTMPTGPAEPVSVELDAGVARTTCTLRFTIDGKEPHSWNGFSGPAFESSFSTGKGLLEAEIPPGRYLVAGIAVVDGEDENGEKLDAWFECSGVVTVPASGRFDATVDLMPTKDPPRRRHRR